MSEINRSKAYENTRGFKCDKSLTIIVPTYNVSKYINRCLDSLTQDEKLLEDLEIIVVNDGSTDDSGEKAQYYADRYPNSVILVNKENGGHGSALNIGIEMATGKYLRVLDSDDWVKTEGLSKQVEYITSPKDVEPDAILNPYEEIWENNGKVILVELTSLNKQRMPFGIDVLNRYQYFPYLWHVSFKTNIYRANAIPKLDEGIFYEDIEYYLYPMKYVKNIVYLPDVICQYRLGTSGQSMNPVNRLKRQWMYEKVMDSINQYRMTGGDAQIMIERRLSRMVGADLNIYLLWTDLRAAKQEARRMVQKYSNLDLLRDSNCKQLKLLIRTHFFGFGLVSILYRIKINAQWRI